MLEQQNADAAKRLFVAQKKQIEDAASEKAMANLNRLVAQQVQAELNEKEAAFKQKEREKQQEIADLRAEIKEAKSNTTSAINQAVALRVAELNEKHIAQTSKLQETISDLGRRLEEKSLAERREEGERDLLVSLKETAHPDDTYDRVGYGAKGADIIQTVMDGGKVAGRIIFENKNTLDWNKAAFISQAKQYRTQYETPYVIIVSRKIPNKEKQNGQSVPVRGMCMIEGILVVEPHLAAPLARALRDGILEIAKLRLSKVNSDEKAQSLYTYIISDEFQTNFHAGSTAASGLKDLQGKERDWHENQWKKEANLIAEIEKSQRKINAGIQSIIKDDKKTPGRESPYAAKGWAASGYDSN